MRGDDSGGELNSINAATHKMRIRQNPVAALVFENLKRSTVFSWPVKIGLLAPGLNQRFFGVQRYYQN